MHNIEILVDGEVGIMSAAVNMHEAGKEVAKHKPRLVVANPGAEITVLIDGKERNETPVDVRRIARNMKSQHIENKLLGCHNV